MHFDDERLPVLGGAVHVIGDLSLLLGQAELLALSDVDVLNLQAENGIERTDDELFLSGILLRSS